MALAVASQRSATAQAPRLTVAGGRSDPELELWAFGFASAVAAGAQVQRGGDPLAGMDAHSTRTRLADHCRRRPQNALKLRTKPLLPRRATMTLDVLDDLWVAVAPLLPPEAPKPNGGRPRAPDRAALAGVLFVLRTGAQWREVPAELGCSGKACWRRLCAWHAAGVWARLHRGPARPLGVGRSHRLVAGVARQRQRAGAKGGEETGPNPTDRGKPGTKRHLVADARGTPLGLTLSPANRHDSRMLAATLDAVPGVRGGKRGRPRRRPGKLHADKRYDHARRRRECRARGVAPRIARRGVESRARLGRRRWVVERTLAWLGQFRRLAVRHKRRADLHLASPRPPAPCPPPPSEAVSSLVLGGERQRAGLGARPRPLPLTR